MKNILLLLLFFIIKLSFSQTQNISNFGNIPDLVYQKTDIKVPLENDTLKNHIMNYHFIKDSLKMPFLIKLNSKLNEESIFLVSNKLGGSDGDQAVIAKLGSALITNKGIFDFGDSLIIDNPVESAKIITYTKKDQSKSPYIFLSPQKEKGRLIPELLVFNRDLSINEKLRIESYLSIKYGISINYISEKNYLSSDNTIIWNFSDNKKYGYRVTGIGRDDTFGLYQRQSKNNEDEIITLSVDSLKTLNYQNTGALNDREYLLWGDNNEEIVFPVEDLLSTNSKGNLLRTWKIQSKSEAPIKTNIYFNLKNIKSSTAPKLKVFRTPENFKNDVADIFAGEKINDSLYIYKNVVWDSDNNKTDYFTLNNSENSPDIFIESSCNDLQAGIVKINIPESLFSSHYTLYDIRKNIIVENSQIISSSPLIFSNLDASQYQITIHQNTNLPDIIKTFDLEGMNNQNVEDNYLWQGTPIELDINFESYQYTLVKPNGSILSHPPYLLDGIGQYTLTVKNKIGCEIQKQLKVLNQTDYANQNQNSLFKNIQLYPNPSKDGVISVKVELKIPKKITIQIYNSLGKLLKQAQYNNTDFIISTLSIPPIVGYYNVKIFIPEESKGYNLIIN